MQLSEITTFNRSQGFALVVSLMILLVVTLIGMAVLNSGLLHNRMTYNTVVYHKAFQMAESGIAATIMEIRGNQNISNTAATEQNAAIDALKGGVYRRCVTANALFGQGGCNNQFLDTNQLFTAEAYVDYREDLPHQDITGFSGLEMAFFDIEGVGTANPGQNGSIVVATLQLLGVQVIKSEETGVTEF